MTPTQFVFFLFKSIGIGSISDSIVGFHTRCVEYQEHGKSFDKVGMFLKNSSSNKASVWPGI